MYRKGLLFDVLEPALRDSCVIPEVLRTLNVGLLCVQNDPERRPSMAQVVFMLMGNTDVEVFLEEPEDITRLQFQHLFGTTDHQMEHSTLETVVEDGSFGFPLLESGFSESSCSSTSSTQRPKAILQMSSLLGR